MKPDESIYWSRINRDLIHLREALREAKAPDQVIRAVQETHRQLLFADELMYQHVKDAARVS